MNSTLCPHCQKTDSNKLLLINGTVDNQNKLIVECKTELGKLTKEFVTTAEIRYCPVCGKKLSTLESGDTKDTKEENECEYCYATAYITAIYRSAVFDTKPICNFYGRRA